MGHFLPHNLTGLTWFIDTHVLDSDAATELRTLRDLGWILLQITDTAAIEIGAAKDPVTRARLDDALWDYPMAKGPMVWDHSQWDRSVWGNDEDVARIRAVYRTLWPNGDYDADAGLQTAKGRTRFRDALHMATSIRYLGSGFVTNDGPVLKRADAIAKAFSGFVVLSVEDATARSHLAISRKRRSASITGTPPPESLPDYPPSAPTPT